MQVRLHSAELTTKSITQTIRHLYKLHIPSSGKRTNLFVKHPPSHSKQVRYSNSDI